MADDFSNPSGSPIKPNKVSTLANRLSRGLANDDNADLKGKIYLSIRIYLSTCLSILILFTVHSS